MKYAFRTIAIAAVLFAAAAPRLRAEETVLELDPAQTKVLFTLGDILHTVHGSFNLKRGSIHFDTATGKAGGELVVDAASGNSGSSGRDRRMHQNILESARYPDITFMPDRVEGSPASGTVQLHGIFRIHGADHELTLPIKEQLAADHFTANTAFNVPYVKWGMKNPSTFILRVNDTVGIEIRAAGRVKQAQPAGAGAGAVSSKL